MEQENNNALIVNNCAWCNQEMDSASERYGFGAKTKSGLKLKDRQGEFVSLKLSLTDKTIIAFVPPDSSPAKESGYDLLFITCSQECAEQLKDILELERDVFED
jgi:hypothetical protein